MRRTVSAVNACRRPSFVLELGGRARARKVSSSTTALALLGFACCSHPQGSLRMCFGLASSVCGSKSFHPRGLPARDPAAPWSCLATAADGSERCRSHGGTRSIGSLPTRDARSYGGSRVAEHPKRSCARMHALSGAFGRGILATVADHTDNHLLSLPSMHGHGCALPFLAGLPKSRYAMPPSPSHSISTIAR